MTKIFCGLVLLFFLWTNISYSQTYAIKIDKYSISPDMRVEFIRFGRADESWRIVGSCKNAINYTKVEIVDFVTVGRVKTVEITKSVLADRDICIVNPEDLPKSVLEMLR